MSPAPIETFTCSLSQDEPPPQCGPALAALWWARRNAWDKAHALVQDTPGVQAAWVHAWLHRVEGDPSNAAYWYRRAGRSDATDSINDEWLAITSELLDSGI